MGFGLVNRDSLPKGTLDEFEFLVSQLQGFLFVAHNEDGTLKAAPAVTNGVPTGFMGDYGGSSDPANWYICDGRQVSRLDDQALFLVIGTAYGAGDGATTFNIPDRRGNYSMGKAAAGTGSILGGTFGALDHTHSVPALSVPILTVSGTTSTVAAHTHTGTTGVGSTAADLTDPLSPGSRPSKIDHVHTFTTDPGGSHSHTITGATTASSTGVGTTGAANPPTLVSNVVIKR